MKAQVNDCLGVPVEWVGWWKRVLVAVVVVVVVVMLIGVGGYNRMIGHNKIV